MNLREARKQFNESIKPHIVARFGKTDTVALDTAFNEWVDALHKDGEITETQAACWVRA